MRIRIAAISLGVVVPILIGAGTAYAADTPQGLSAEQRATLKLLDTPTTVARAATKVTPPQTNQPVTAAATYSARLTLYRGSALMWARDTMNWYYTGSAVTSSSLMQEAGYIFPNTSQAKGVTRYYTSSSQHAWRGNYTIGAGVVTPWGAVTVYAQDYSTDWHVYGTGAGNGRWNN